MELNLSFKHGLGDCVNFVHLLELYRRRGFQINLHCAEDKSVVFAPLEANAVGEDHPDLDCVWYPESRDATSENATAYWQYNKLGINISEPPLPPIGDPADLWEEILSLRIDLRPHLTEEHWRSVDDFLRDLPRPVVLLHSMGNTLAEMKNMPPAQALRLYKELLDRTEGTLVLLDWDDRVPRLANWRVRHMTDDWQWIDVPTLVALLHRSDLLISVDSGPLHLARVTDIPVIGLFPTRMTYPSRMTLPRKRTISIVPGALTKDLNPATRVLYNIVESPGVSPFNPRFIAEVAQRVLAGPRYLTRDDIGADIQLQQFVLEWQRNKGGYLSHYGDRHRGFDILFQEMRKRFSTPLIVETGCIRWPEDWKGTGYSTYLLGAFAHRTGGELISVDIEKENCEFARQATRELKSVHVVQQDSVSFLCGYDRPIDVLYLDSMDTDEQGVVEHTFEEIQAAYCLLHKKSVVVIDDTVYNRKAFVGHGAMAVPWLLNDGWRILHSGYQTILVRD